MAQVKKFVEVAKEKLPKPIFIKTITDFKVFEETAERVASLVLYAGWKFSSKVGGAIFKGIKEKSPQNDDVLKMERDAELKKKTASATPSGATTSPTSTTASTPVVEEEKEKAASCSSTSSSQN